MKKLFRRFMDLKYYSSIDDMPIYNWFKVQETNDLTWCLIKRRGCDEYELEKLAIALDKMTDQYIDAFGISDSFRRILELKRDIACLQNEFALTDERVNLTYIEIKKRELQSVSMDDQKREVNTIAVHAAKWVGHAIDQHTTSVKYFYSIIHEFKRELETKK